MTTEGMQSQTSSNCSKAGYLRRPGKGKSGKSFGLRRKRFFKLDGGLLSKHNQENSEPSWVLNIQGARIHQLSSTAFAVQLQKVDKDASKDFDNNVIILYCKTEEECSSWVETLRTASIRKVEGEYEIGDVIGEGGFAVVRVGRCKKSGELRAIKTIEREEEHAKLHGREIAIIKRVNHPNIVKTYDVFETESEIHIVMEYMKGGMLYGCIEDGIRFQEQDVVQMMREMLDGIIYLHQQGIVHRDLKPENVLCTRATLPFHVKISDFGLSSMADIADMRERRVMMRTMIGTPEFIAPEIANRQPYTEKVDVWALGMLCYNTIARRLPLDEGRDMMSQIRGGVTLTFCEEEWQWYGEEAKSFMRAVLCTDAEKRLSAFGCLVHPWLDSIKERKGLSTKIGAHGRFSALFVGDATVGGARGCRKRWSVAVAAVRAVNRLRWVGRAREGRATGRQSGDVWSECGGRDVSGCEGWFVDEAVSVGALDALSGGDEGEDGEGEQTMVALNYSVEFADGSGDGGGSKLSNLLRGLQRRYTPRNSKRDEGAEGSGDGGKRRGSGSGSGSGSVSVGGGEGESCWEVKADDGAGSSRGRSGVGSRVVNAMSRKASNKLKPVRKLSKRLLGKAEAKAEAKGRGGLSPLAGAAMVAEFDAQVGRLGVTEVDDSDVALLEEREAKGRGGSGGGGSGRGSEADKAKKGKGKKKKEKKKKKKVEGEADGMGSPCTPKSGAW